MLNFPTLSLGDPIWAHRYAMPVEISIMFPDKLKIFVGTALCYVEIKPSLNPFGEGETIHGVNFSVQNKRVTRLRLIECVKAGSISILERASDHRNVTQTLMGSEWGQSAFFVEWQPLAGNTTTVSFQGIPEYEGEIGNGYGNVPCWDVAVYM